MLQNVTPDYAGRTQVTATGPTASMMARNGRYGDTMMAHVTPGEIVVPRTVQTPAVVNTLMSEMQRRGINPSRYVVGSGANSMNPGDGAQEHFSLGKVIGKVAGIAGKVASVATGNPLFAVGGDLLGGLAGGGGASGGMAASTSGGGASGGPLSNLPPTTAASIASVQANRETPTRLGSYQSTIPGMTTGDSGGGKFDINDLSFLLDRIKGNTPGTVPEFYDQATSDMRANSMNPTTGKAEFYVDENYTGAGRNERETAIRNAGYTGAFGNGQADNWLMSTFGNTNQPTAKAPAAQPAASTYSAPATSTGASPTASASTNTPWWQGSYVDESYTGAGRNQREQDIRNLGYTGAFGRGQADSWLTSRYGSTDLSTIKNPPYNPPAVPTAAQNAANAQLSNSTAPKPATTPAPAATTPAATSTTANKPVKVTSIIKADPIQAMGRNAVIAGIGDRVTLSDGRTVVVGRNDLGNNSYLLVGSDYAGQAPAAPAAPAPAATTPVPTTTTPQPAAPAAPVQTYNDPRYLNELIGREIGYQGPWGAGGMEAWLNANPQKRAEMTALLAQRGGQRAITPEDMQRFGTPGGNAPQQQQDPQWLMDLRDRLTALQALQQAAQAASTANASAPGQGTSQTTDSSTTSAPEPAITRVSSLTPTRSNRFGSRRYRGSLARNF